MTHEEMLLKVAVSVLLGSIIGLEREYRGKSAGFRTIILITTGAALFTMLSQLIGKGEADRIASNIVTGIGFLGAGVIFRDHKAVSGLTTAASVWAAAAIGMAVGAGYYFLAAAGCGIILVVLLLFLPVQNKIDQLNLVKVYQFRCAYADDVIDHYRDFIGKYHLRVLHATFHKEDNNLNSHWTVQGTERNHQRMLRDLLRDPAIVDIHF